MNKTKKIIFQKEFAHDIHRNLYKKFVDGKKFDVRLLTHQEVSEARVDWFNVEKDTLNYPVFASPDVIYCWDNLYSCEATSNSIQFALNHTGRGNGEIISLKKFRADFFELFIKYAEDSKIFIRPVSGSKFFTGQILDLQDCPAFLNCYADLSDDIHILITKPRKILGEWRFVCFNNAILGYSTYKFQNNITIIPSAPPGGVRFVQNILDKTLVDKENTGLKLPINEPFVLDIGLVSDKMYPDNPMCAQYRIIEINSFWSSNFYAIDPEKIYSLIDSQYNLLFSN